MDFSTYPATLIILLATGLISFLAFQNEDLLRKWLFNPGQIQHKKEYYRLISSGFIHADLGHLIFNMITFYFFGRLLESIFSTPYFFGPLKGNLVFAAFYLGGIVLSSLPDLIQRKGSFQYNSLGASGGVNAILFSTVLFAPLQKIYLFFIPIGIPAIIFATLYLGYTFYYSRRQGQGGINHNAHLWGAIYGVVLTILLIPESIEIFLNRLMAF